MEFDNIDFFITAKSTFKILTILAFIMPYVYNSTFTYSSITLTGGNMIAMIKAYVAIYFAIVAAELTAKVIVADCLRLRGEYIDVKSYLKPIILKTMSVALIAMLVVLSKDDNLSAFMPQLFTCWILAKLALSVLEYKDSRKEINQETK